MTARLALPILLAPALAFTFLGCGTRPSPWNGAKPEQKRVLAVTPPLACFAQNIGGDKVFVLCLLSATGPHGYSPTADDNLKARDAHLFLANGLGLDDFVKKIATSSGNKKLEILSVGTAFEEKAHDDAELHELLIHSDEGGHVHIHDEHVWLSPPVVKVLAAMIADKLGDMDGANTKVYQENNRAFAKQIDGLIAEGKKAFAGKEQANFFVMHDSMKYFAYSFGLKQPKPIQVAAGGEVEPKHLAKLVAWARETKPRVICVEPQYPRASAETLQKSLKNEGIEVELVEFDPLETVAEGETLDTGYYIRRMSRNIKNLAEKLR